MMVCKFLMLFSFLAMQFAAEEQPGFFVFGLDLIWYQANAAPLNWLNRFSDIKAKIWCCQNNTIRFVAVLIWLKEILKLRF